YRKMLPAWLVYHPGCSCCLTMFWRLPEKTIYLIFGPIWKFTFMEVLVSFPIKSNTKIFYQKKILGIMKFIMLRKVFLPYRTKTIPVSYCLCWIMVFFTNLSLWIPMVPQTKKLFH